VTPVFFDKSDAVKLWAQINKDKEPKIEVFDLSALLKKVFIKSKNKHNIDNYKQGQGAQDQGA
jgi:hypothetical protein